MVMTEDDVFDAERNQPPRFMSQMRSNTHVAEMSPAKFECQLAPVGDPSMRVEWFFNGKPLIAKTQFQLINDFGYVALNFGWVYKQDSGEYMVRATNKCGSAELSANLVCSGPSGINYDTQLPKEMMAAIVQNAKITKEIQTNRIKEGTSTEFTAGFAGNPQPEVAWFYNGNKLGESDRVKITTNTTTSTLHMDDCTMEMDGVYECRIDNKLGSDKTKASLIISPQSD